MFNTSIEYVTYNIIKDGRFIKLIVLVVIGFVALAGNLFFIAAVFYRRPINKQSRTFVYFAFVSLTNLGTAIFVMPFPIITLATKKWSLSPTMCYFNGMMSSFWLTSCVYSITILSIHKYASITQPMRNKVISHKPVLCRILTTILLSFVVTVVPFFHNRVYFNPYTAQCAVKIYRLGDVLYMVLSLYIIPTIINVVIFYRIVVALKKHRRRLRFTTFYEPRLLASQKRMMKTLYLAFLVFICSWTPFFIYAVLYVAKHGSTSSKYFLAIAYISGFANSALNPIIFIFRNLRVRDGKWSAIFKQKQIPKLALVPSISRAAGSFDDHRSSYYMDITQNEHANAEIHPCFLGDNHFTQNACSRQENVFDRTPVPLKTFDDGKVEITFQSALGLYYGGDNVLDTKV